VIVTGAEFRALAGSAAAAPAAAPATTITASTKNPRRNLFIWITPLLPFAAAPVVSLHRSPVSLLRSERGREVGDVIVIRFFERALQDCE
jgi:hypothetical protein